MPRHRDLRSYLPSRRRRLVLLATLVGSAALVLVPGASAHEYSGSTAQWGKLTATISSGTVTAFATTTGRLQTCDGQPRDDSMTNPLRITYAGPPVAIMGGTFQLVGAAVNGFNDQLSFTVDGTLSKDGREVSGTITAGGMTRIGGDCTGSWGFDAIIPPAGSVMRPEHDFSPPDTAYPPPATVTFDYARGVVTHLVAGVGVTCPGGSSFGASVDSTASGLDPIHVNKSGHFKLSGAELDDYGVIIHYVINGRIKGARASGRVNSARLYDTGNIDGKDVVTCGHSASWKAVQPPKPATPTKPATPATATKPAAPTIPATPLVSSGPTAYYDVTPYRYGRAGAWNYYLKVQFSGCRDATTVTVAVAGGPHLTAACHGSVKLGPLKPQQTYQVTVGAIPATEQSGRAGQPVAAPPSTIYLPGDDGIWVRD